MYGASVERDEEATPLPVKLKGVVSDRIVTSESPIEVRHAFVRGVLFIVTILLAVTTALSWAVMWTVKPWDLLWSNPWVFWGSLIGSLVFAGSIYLAWLRNSKLMRRSPTNYIMLSLFTLSMSVTVGAIDYWIQHVLIVAFLFFTITSLALTLFCCQTRYDFKTCTPYLLTLVVMVACIPAYVVIVDFLVVPFGLPVMQAYDFTRISVGAFLGWLCSCDMIFTTQGVMMGESYMFEDDEYCSGAIMIFVECQDPCFMPLELCGTRDYFTTEPQLIAREKTEAQLPAVPDKTV